MERSCVPKNSYTIYRRCGVTTYNVNCSSGKQFVMTPAVSMRKMTVVYTGTGKNIKPI